MGYTSDFDGAVTIDPPLNEHEIAFLQDLASSRRMERRFGPLYVGGANDGNFGQSDPGDVITHSSPDPEQPSLWLQWQPSADGTQLAWDEGEKFYKSAEWMKYLVENLLAPSARDYLDRHIEEDPRLVHFTCDHTVNGIIDVQGEEPGDTWRIVVENNIVFQQGIKTEWGEKVIV